jgi:uncharacterized RmlC-like cupin family protein
MHYHPESLAVFLTDHHISFEKPDGSSEEVQVGAGEHRYGPAEQHLPTNLGDEPLELILVELKSAGTASGESGPDPTVEDPDHYTAEFENERVRVLRIRYGAGEESPGTHYHPDGVAVFLTDQHVNLEQPDGTANVIESKAGEHKFAPGGPHLPKNLADEPFELILVELKGS